MPVGPHVAEQAEDAEGDTEGDRTTSGGANTGAATLRQNHYAAMEGDMWLHDDASSYDSR